LTFCCYGESYCSILKLPRDLEILTKLTKAQLIQSAARLRTLTQGRPRSPVEAASLVMRSKGTLCIENPESKRTAHKSPVLRQTDKVAHDVSNSSRALKLPCFHLNAPSYRTIRNTPTQAERVSKYPLVRLRCRPLWEPAYI
jgi:hypothetical protein